MNTKTIFPILLAIALTGCGGGGGGGGGGEGGGAMTPQQEPEPEQPEQSTYTPAPPPTNVDRLPFPFRSDHAGNGTPHYDTKGWLPENRRADAKQMPIYTDGAAYSDGGDLSYPVRRPRVFVGVDQGTEHIGRLPVTGGRGDAEIRFGQLHDGIRRNELVAFLQDAITDQDVFYDQITVKRWAQAPVVRLIGDLDVVSQDLFVAAIRLINTALPERSKLSMGDPLPGLSLQHIVNFNTGAVDGTAFGESAQSSTIFIEQISPNNVSNTAGLATTLRLSDAPAEYFSSYIALNVNNVTFQSERNAVIVLAHELMHTLGLDDNNHLAGNYASLMEAGPEQGVYDTEQDGEQQPVSLLYPIDRAALRALYSLDPGDDPAQLGPWASTSTHIAGNGPHASFGVAMRNGYAEPWAYGYLSPAGGPNSNSALSGTITWAGDLVGFTPRSRPVTGDAAITLAIGTLTGNADFTGLEQWDAGQAPGAAGSGAMWGDGDLGYSISVRGNTFRDAGGDDGRLTGVWTGLAHEGVAGTLERADLTAAFGGSREE